MIEELEKANQRVQFLETMLATERACLESQTRAIVAILQKWSKDGVDGKTMQRVADSFRHNVAQLRSIEEKLK